MAVVLNDKVVVAMFVVLLMVSSVSMFILYETWGDSNPDEREESRSYVFDGTVYGEHRTGTGVSEHIVYRAGIRLYTVTVDIEGMERMSFDLLFDSSDVPDSEMYTYVGESMDGTGSWRHSEGGVDYTFHISEGCVLEKVVMVSDRFELTGTLVRG